MEYISQILSSQKAFFQTQGTKDLNFRKIQLHKLYQVIKSSEKEISAALFKDFHKPEFESYSSETGMVLNEIRSLLHHLKKWSAPKRVYGNWLDFPSSGMIYPEPYGQVLIIAPWNYPFQLVMVPLAGAIAAGNTAIIKPSEISKNTSAIIAKIIKETFSENYVACIEGGIPETEYLLSQKSDFIFFTGSPTVGKIVMRAAADNLTPVTLELGGKCPCFIDETVPLNITARRIAWGKFTNAGQTCVAPDYLVVKKKISGELKKQLKNYIVKFYGTDPYKSPDFSRIINLTHFNRINALIDTGKIYYGGQTFADELYIAPTILHNITINDKIMQEEIFGPVLPILEYETLDEAVQLLACCPNPLSLYLFTNNKHIRKRIISEIPAGNGNLNDTIMQYVNKNLPLGGVGNSGFGRYHGKYSFECFSNMKAMNRKSLLLDIPLRYPPYTPAKLNILRKLFK